MAWTFSRSCREALGRSDPCRFMQKACMFALFRPRTYLPTLDVVLPPHARTYLPTIQLHIRGFRPVTIRVADLRSLRRSSSPSARCTHGRRRVLSVRRRRGAAALPQRPRLRRHALELLVRQAPRWHRAPAVMCQVHMTAAARDAHLWTCSQASHARQQAGAARAPSSALSATGASGLFRSPLLQSRCLEAAIFATDLRLRLRRLSARRLPSLGPDPAALAHPVEVPRGYAVACVCGYFWVPGTFVGTRILFGPRASGPQTSFRMAPPRERGVGDASSEHC